MKNNILIIFTILLIGVFLWIMHLKNISLHNWLYGSDLGNYDTILQETLKGNFGVEYNYGNTFGDHSSFSFLLFLPFKWLFGPKLLDILIAITPLCYLCCGLTILYFLYKNEVAWPLMLMLIPGYIFHLHFLKGNYEENYGFHIDTASGYILTIITLILAFHKNLKYKNFLIITLYLWFVFLKEEMAMLAILFFGIIWLVDKQKKYLKWTIVSVVIFIIQLVLIQYFRTPFNRGNSFFITTILTKIEENGFWGILSGIPMNTYWNFILFYSITYGLLLYILKFNKFAFALFTIGLVKAAITFVTGDYFFDSWHGFPAMSMFSGAIIIQSVGPLKLNPLKIKYLHTVLGIYTLISLVSIETDYRYSIPIKGCANANSIYKKQIKGYLEDIKRIIPKNKVVALNEYTITEFAEGFRYSLFPRGASLIPEGIADYILLNKEINGISFLAIHKAKELDTKTAGEFQLVTENPGFKLYKRVKPSKSDHKEKFIKYCGINSLR